MLDLKYFHLAIKVSSIDADEGESQTTGIIENEIPMKERKGRSAPKAKINELSGIVYVLSCDFLYSYNYCTNALVYCII